MKLQSGRACRSCLVGCLVVIALLVAGYFLAGPSTVLALFKTAVYAKKEGFLDPEQQRQWEGTSKQNLQALQTAILKYADSEGQFPKADSWMDAIQPYIKTADLSEEEAKKKFVNPLLQPAKAGVYGYAMNDALSEKLVEDVKDPQRVVLLFDSAKAGWNAHGDPKKDAASPERPGGNKAIPVKGDVAALKALTASP